MEDLIFCLEDLGPNADTRPWRERLRTPDPGDPWWPEAHNDACKANASDGDNPATEKDEKAIKSA